MNIWLIILITGIALFTINRIFHSPIFPWNKKETRFNSVKEFRHSILMECLEYNKRHAESVDRANNAFIWCWDALPTFHEMYEDERPLEIEYYLDGEIISRLRS